MKKVEILKHEYEIGKMPAMKQMLILKRMAPVVGPLQAIASNFDDMAPEGTLKAVGDAIAALPDESVEFITSSCLDVCSKKQEGGGYAPIRQNGALMYPDLDLVTILSLCAHALIYNFQDFFHAIPSLGLTGGEGMKG